MKSKLITVGSEHDLHIYKECIISQAVWAKKHGIEHEIIETEVDKTGNWIFYENFITTLVDNEETVVIAMMPEVMVLEDFSNPFLLDKDLIVVNSGDIAVIAGRFSGSILQRANLLQSLAFKDTPHSSCDLGLHVLDTKVKNYIHFMAGISGKPEYPCMSGLNNSHGFEMHAKTYKDEAPGIKYNYSSYANQFYRGGDFAVNLKVANIELSIGFIKEFKKMKERIDTLVMELSHFEKDVLEPVTEDETLKNNV